MVIDAYIRNFYPDDENNSKLISILEKEDDNTNIQNVVKKDNNSVKKNDDSYFFSNIIFFTNERNASKNKTLKNMEEAIKGKNINLVVFVADEVEYKASDNKIDIWDTQNKYTIKEQSNIDTIVIARLGVQDSEECMECIKELQAWGLFVLNPVEQAKKASNKYSSSVLMERYNIPQPRFTLVSKIDIKDGMKTLWKKLKHIYPDVDIDDKEVDKLEYVIKILDGHGGTGVCLVTGKIILSILQALFAVDEEREFLIQKKEEGDGGDIRVHVYTGRTHQTIMASMKRVKLSGDFRSNVSLGARAEKIEITKEQKAIALKVAEISGMPWCAVDIMPLVKGSNPEIGDNVVLEYNASPGTDGISEVIGENFVKVLLDTINDVDELILEPKSIGYREDVKFNVGDEHFILEGKFDTGNGAKSSTIGCESIIEEGNNLIAKISGKEFTFEKYGQSTPIVGQQEEIRNTVIIDEIQIGTRKLHNVEFALVDNRKKSTPVLINRDVMRRMAYYINPNKKNTLKIEPFDINKIDNIDNQ